MPAKPKLETMSFLEDLGIAKQSKKKHEQVVEEKHKTTRRKRQSAPKSKGYHRQTFANLIHDAILRLNRQPFSFRHCGASKRAIARDVEKHYDMRLGTKFDTKLKLSLAKLVNQGKLIPIGNRNTKYILSQKFVDHSQRPKLINGHANSHSNIEMGEESRSYGYDSSGSRSLYSRSRSRHRRSRSPHKRSKSSTKLKSRTKSWFGSRSGSGSGSKAESPGEVAPNESGSKPKEKGSKSKSLTESWFGFGNGSDSESSSSQEENEPTLKREKKDTGSGESSPNKKGSSGNFTGWLWPTPSASNEGKVDQTSHKQKGFGGVFGRFRRGRSPAQQSLNRSGSRQSSRGKSTEHENVASPRSQSSGLRHGLGRVFERFKRGRSREKTISRSESRQNSRGRSTERQNVASPRSQSSGLGGVLKRFKRGRSREKTVSRSHSRPSCRGRSTEHQNVGSPRSQSSGLRQGVGREFKRSKRGRSSDETRSRSQSDHNSRGRSTERRNLASPRSQSSGLRQGMGRVLNSFKRGRPRRRRSCHNPLGRLTERRKLANPRSQSLGLRRRGLRSSLKRRKMGKSLEKTVSRRPTQQRRKGRSTECQHLASPRAQSLGPPSPRCRCNAVTPFPNRRRSIPIVKCPPALAKLRARPRITKVATLEDNPYSSAPARPRSTPRITKVATIVDNPDNNVEDSEHDSDELQGAKDNNKDAHEQPPSPKQNSRQSCKRQDWPASATSTSENGRFLNPPLASRLKNLHRE